MKPVLQLIEQGGPVMFAIIALAIVLYARCCKLLLAQGRARRRLRDERAVLVKQPRLVRHLQEHARESFRHERIVLGAMIAAAPLLGLLGTVSGMAKTFDSLAAPAGEKSMESLAGGISEVLVATQSGLAVAIPALLLVYAAHRAMLRHVEQLNALEQNALARAAS